MPHSESWFEGRRESWNEVTNSLTHFLPTYKMKHEALNSGEYNLKPKPLKDLDWQVTQKEILVHCREMSIAFPPGL